jgi:glycine hydroxymethyltransferase
MLRATVATASHADGGSGGQAAAQRLREANFPRCAIGLPDRPAMAGLRFGTPEVVRSGMSDTDMTTIAGLVARALSGNPRAVAQKTTTLRRRYDTVGFTRQ